jgi:hypothetical protein
LLPGTAVVVGVALGPGVGVLVPVGVGVLVGVLVAVAVDVFVGVGVCVGSAPGSSDHSKVALRPVRRSGKTIIQR